MSMLEKTSAKYPLRRTEIRTCYLTDGRREFMHNIFSNVIPRRLVLAMVNNRAYNGDIALDPFKFEPFSVEEILMNAGGLTYPASPYKMKWGENGESCILRPYMVMMDATMSGGDNTTNGITLQQYASGWTFFVVTLTPTPEDHRGFELVRNGTTKLHMRFSKEIETPGVMLLCLAESDQLLSIDQHRVVLGDGATSSVFLKCVPADGIPTSDTYPYAVVVNTDAWKRPGRHWVAIFIAADGVVEYFDSLGLTAIDGERPFCIYFLVKRCAGHSFTRIVDALRGPIVIGVRCNKELFHHDDDLTTLSYGTGRLCQVAFAPARDIVWANVRYPYSVVATQPHPVDLPHGRRATRAYACFERRARSYLWLAARTDDDADAGVSLIYEGTRLLSEAPVTYAMGGYDEYTDSTYVVKNTTLMRMSFDRWLTSDCANTTRDAVDEVLYDVPSTLNLTHVTKLTVIGGSVFLGRDDPVSPSVQISSGGEATFMERHVEPAVCDALRGAVNVDSAVSSLLSAHGASNLFSVLMLAVVVFFVYSLRYRLNIRHGAATVSYKSRPPVE